MTDKYCIIIDDEDQDEIVENLKADAKSKGIGLTCFQLNPQDDEFHKNTGTDAIPEFVIDIEKIADKLKTTEYRRAKVDVIACDYLLQDDHVNGFEIIRKLRNQLNYKKSIILYSATLDTVISEILLGDLEDRVSRIMKLVDANIPANLEAGVREVLTGDLKEQVQRIRNLARADIMAFTDKDNYRASIVTALEKDPFSLDSELDSLLNTYRNWTFRSVFPPFKDKTVAEIIDEIDSGSANGVAFQRALLENAIAHMIDLNRDINE